MRTMKAERSKIHKTTWGIANDIVLATAVSPTAVLAEDRPAFKSVPRRPICGKCGRRPVGRSVVAVLFDSAAA